MNDTLQIFKQKIYEEELSKTETYWIDQIEFKVEESDLIISVNSEFVKSSIEKKVFDKILEVVKNISGLSDCIFELDPTKKTSSLQSQETVPSENKTFLIADVDEGPNYDISVFDDLLIGSSNNLAVTAAKNVVQNPGTRFNPLFIHGQPGVGKTHLLKKNGGVFWLFLLY